MRHELTRRMLAVGLPAGPVLNVDEAIAGDHTAHRNMVTELGGYRGLGTPIKLSRTPGWYPERAAALQPAGRGGGCARAAFPTLRSPTWRETACWSRSAADNRTAPA